MTAKPALAVLTHANRETLRLLNGGPVPAYTPLHARARLDLRAGLNWCSAKESNLAGRSSRVTAGAPLHRGLALLGWTTGFEPAPSWVTSRGSAN